MPALNARPTDHTHFDFDFRRDTTLLHIDLRLAEITERHARLRDERARERLLSLDRSRISIRRRLGTSIIRIGERIGGSSDPLSTPVWQG